MSVTLISNMTVLFSNSSPKIPKLDIFGPKFKGFIFAPNFLMRKIRGRRLQIWLSLCDSKHPNKAILVPNLGIHFFARNFTIRQIQILQQLSKILTQKHSN